MRITKSVVRDLSIFMIGFGISIGIIFPFFSLYMGVSPDIALSVKFFMACVFAGILVGGINVLMLKRVLLTEMKMVTDKMMMIKSKLIALAKGNYSVQGACDDCYIDMASEDDLGKNIYAYNQLVEVLSLKMEGEKILECLDQQQVLTHAIPKIMTMEKVVGAAVFIEEMTAFNLAYSEGCGDLTSIQTNEWLQDTVKSEAYKRIRVPDQVDLTVNLLLTEMVPKEVVLMPLVFSEDVIGVLMTAATEEFIEADIEKIEVMAKSIGIALHNARIHKQIQALASIDPLTEVYNRRFGEKVLKREYYKANESSLQMGILMVDLDYFKEINDTLGHSAGDLVLSEVARRLKASVRESDLVMRYGGDEFILVLPGASKDIVLDIAEKIRVIISDKAIPYGERDIEITASIGVVSLKESSAKDLSHLMRIVDKALYRSKELGRNCHYIEE